MIKRFLSVLMLVVFVFVLLSGCGTQTVEEQTTAKVTSQATSKAATSETVKETEPAKPMTLQLYTHSNPPLELAWNQLCQKYNMQFPNITVNYNVIPMDQFETKLPILFATKQEVDIINIHDRYVAPYMSQLSTAPDYVVEDMKTNAPSSYKAGLMNGKTYGYLYPVAAVAIVNKKMFADAGLKYPTTWDELRAANKALTKKVTIDGKEVQQFGSNLWWGSGSGVFITAYWNNVYASLGGVLLPTDGSKININNETAIKATELFKENCNRDGNFLTDFEAGNLGYMFGASWCVSAIRTSGVKGLEFEVINCPMGISGQPVAQGYFQMVVVPNFRSQEIQDAAWKFNAWAHNDENNYILETIGGVGDWRLDTMKRVGAKDPAIQSCYDAAPYATAPLIHPKWATVEKIIADWVEKCVYDKATAAEAMAGAQAELDKALQ